MTTGALLGGLVVGGPGELVERVDAEEAHPAGVDQILHGAEHSVVGEILRSAGLGGKNDDRTAVVAMADNPKSRIRPRDRKLDACTHALYPTPPRASVSA
jgi:hypothetical protein